MNKLRIMSNNFTTDTDSVVVGNMYRMQRLFVDTNVFTVGDTVTDGTTGGAIILNKGSLINLVSGARFFIDILLVNDTIQLVPNPTVTTPTLISNGVLTSMAREGRVIPTNYTGFLADNVKDSNRNRICTAQNTIEDKLIGYKSLTLNIFKTTASVTNVVNSVAILNHNLSDTATVTFKFLSGATVLGTETVTTINNNMFSVNTHYYSLSGSSKLTLADKKHRYKNKNVAKLYLANSYTNVTSIVVDIYDNNNVDDFVFIGNIYIGEFYEVQTNMRDNWSVQTVDPSVTTYAQSPFSVEKDPYDILSLTFVNVSSDEKQFWLDLYRRNGTFNDIIFDLFNDPQDPNDNYYLIYGRFGTSFKISNSFLHRFSLPVKIRESI